ncbi:mavicyanin-like [Andrographis paniculata]|uniref:mavicyanin-like n=1 Tax=Andrographis paniculata TaxID=175694 RepID=UPI0021E7A9E9|nr:mavicyanin-like [Andrographis paniculata]
MGSSSSILLLSAIITLLLSPAQCKDLLVGGDAGWVVPPPNNHHFYNDWASRNRFRTNDTLRFQYEKESVMAVADEEEYEQCRSSHPMFFANNGNTSVTLDRPGLFYFISGVAGHCKRGLKMIVKVLEPPSPPLQAADDRSSPNGATAVAVAVAGFIPTVSALCSFL